MKIVSFTMVNNESEIIESFIRYNYNFIDEMVIIDNGCTDHTIKIIQNLVDEGYNIKIFDESLEAYDQYRLDNKYLTKIIDELDPDLIIPLDADEFLASDENPRSILESLTLDRIYYVTWRWYVLTNQDDKKEPFIPKRLQYCLTESAWNYSDKKPVTKAIIPAKYYKKLGLKLSMGHHTVFGNDNVKIIQLRSLQFAHYRAIGEQQLVYKTCCYTMRDIATMENNFETAQRTNQMSSIEQGVDLWETVVESSFGGYPHKIEKRPLNLNFCRKDKLEMKYITFSNESIENRILYTGREMAIRAYNSERSKKEKPFLKPIILWLDGVRGEECVFPNPSNKLTMLTEMFNVRGLVTLENRIKFLKANYRIIVMPDFVKFLPHEFIVISDNDFENTKEKLINTGLPREKIISLNEYKKKLGIIKRTYCWILFVPSMIKRIQQYVQRNGLKNTLTKIKSRVER